MKQPLSSLLARKGRTIYQIKPTATVAQAVRLMAEKRIGSVLVMEGTALVGIFTERDALNRVLDKGLDASKLAIHEVMTPKPIVAGPEMAVEEAMMIMTERRLRRLPVVADGHLVGLISIGDLTKWVVRENEQLSNYVWGKYPG